MISVVLVIGVIVLAISVAALIAPAVFRGMVDVFRPRGMLYVAALIRIAVGIVLLVAAPESRFPLGVRVLAAITVVAGGVLPFLKEPAANALFDWVLKMPNSGLRGFALMGIVLGAFLVYVAI